MSLDTGMQGNALAKTSPHVDAAPMCRGEEIELWCQPQASTALSCIFWWLGSMQQSTGISCQKS